MTVLYLGVGTVIVAVLPLAEQGRVLCHIVLCAACICLGAKTVVEFCELVLQVGKVCRRNHTGSKHLNCLEGVVKELAYKLLCISHGILALGALLGRVLVGALVCAVACKYKTVEPELGSTQHCGECTAKELNVACIFIVLPQVRAEPCVLHGRVMHPVTYTTKDVVLGKGCPATVLARLLSIVLPLFALRHVDDPVEERNVHLAEVGYLGRPVVHLYIDVCVDIAVPLWTADVVPKTLKVAGQRHTA